MKKKTLILGASPKPVRYSYKAAIMLLEKGYTVSPVGIRKGTIEGYEILLNKPELKNIDTVTLYVGAKNQPEYYEYIINTIQPKRIIFNPGTENDELISLAKDKGIETEIACTLVLLSLNSY
ncbi:MAG: CoA-binding protein [Vicingaceae bacterium]|nr:CoA-binding protein [Vicingaceae bacterium]